MAVGELSRPSAVVLRALALGDLLTAVPALRTLRAALPGHRIVLAAPAALRPVLDLAQVVDEVCDVRGLEVPLPAGLAHPDVAVNLHGRGPQSHVLLDALEPRELVAFAAPVFGDPRAPAWVEHEHEVHRWHRLVAAWFGPAPLPGLGLSVPPGEPRVAGATVVHPGAAWACRRWPVERYGAVARMLAAQGHDVVVTGSAAERADALAVASVAGLPESAVLAGRTDLTELAALVAHARLLVSGDTGVAHLATAYERASVVLFGPAPPARWAPPDSPRHAVLWKGPADDPWRQGDVFSDAPDPLLGKIEVDDVLAACEQVLAGSPTP